MGIKGLHQIIKKYAEEVYVEKHLSNYAYKKVAIDISLYIFKYKAIFGERWINSFIKLISILRKNEIHCVFVFDGKAPVEKDNEKKLRTEQREKLESKISNIEFMIDKYNSSGEIDDELIKICEEQSDKSKFSLLKINKKVFDIRVVQDYLDKIKSQVISISKDDVVLIKELFDILNIPHIQAPGEAESYCSYLCVNGIVNAVLSEDTDVLAYGTPIFITKINVSTETCIEIDFNMLLELLELEKSQFVDLCIMCGTDYNTNIKGIGPDKSIKLIKEYKSIERIEEKYDTSVLNYVRCRELFTVPELNVKIEYCGCPNFDLLKKFLFKNNIYYDMSNLIKCFEPPEIIIIDN
jgi:flap endonuclease-1